MPGGRSRGRCVSFVLLESLPICLHLLVGGGRIVNGVILDERSIVWIAAGIVHFGGSRVLVQLSQVAQS